MNTLKLTTALMASCLLFLLNSLCYAAADNKHLIVAVGVRGTIVTSTDGVNWSLGQSGVDEENEITSVVYANNHYTALDSMNNHCVVTSNDGISWTLQDTDSCDSFPKDNLIWNRNQYYAFDGLFGDFYKSADGVNWKYAVKVPDSNTYGAVASDELAKQTYVAVSGFISHHDSLGSIYFSQDQGYNWTKVKGPFPSFIAPPIWGKNQFVAAGQFLGDADPFEPGILTSPDGQSWTLHRLNDSKYVRILHMVWANNLYVAVGDSSWQTGVIFTSPDGITWTRRDIVGAASTLSSVKWINNQFIAVGLNGTIVTSPDGVNWTAQVSGTPYTLDDVA